MKPTKRRETLATHYVGFAGFIGFTGSRVKPMKPTKTEGDPRYVLRRLRGNGGYRETLATSNSPVSLVLLSKTDEMNETEVIGRRSLHVDLAGFIG